MWKRIQQVYSAITAKIEPKDRHFIQEHLNEKEQKLFWQMNLPDQRHVLNVAYTALDLAHGRPEVNQALLLKCALLHDVGKVKGDVSTMDKVITVVVHAFAASWAKKWGCYGRGNKVKNLRHAFYIYYHHPERSAAMLGEIQTERAVIEIIAKHHKTPAEQDPPELVLLRAADDMH